MPEAEVSLAKRKREDEEEDEVLERGRDYIYKSRRSVYAKEYVVEKVVGHQLRHGEHKFLVKWEGWSEDCNTWEPAQHLDHCPARVDEFFNEALNQHAIEELCKTLMVSSDVSNKSLETLLPPQGFSALRNKRSIQYELISLISIPPSATHTKKLKKGKEALLLYFLHLRRDAQSIKLKEWEENINHIACEDVILKVENNVDLEEPPLGFTYINEYIPMEGIVIPDDPPIGCECEACNPKEKNCCGKNYSLRFVYRDNDKINVPQGTPIYECNRACKCDSRCRNRVVQKGRIIPLCIFRTSNGCGWGVKALKKIFAGEFVCEYVGEVITHEEAERRGSIYDQEGRTYLFDLDFNVSENPYTVDAATHGNVSHFINHSCEPNLGVWAVWVNCLDPNIPKLALFATREIQKGEEITFDYMSGHKSASSKKKKKDGDEQKEGLSSSPGRARLELPDENDGEKKNRPLCKCGAKSCRRYLF